MARKPAASSRARPADTADDAPRQADPFEAAVDPVTRTLCEQVRAIRRERGWSLAKLATASGVSRSMLSQIERGEVNPTLTVAHRIAQAFGTPLSRLIDAPAGPRIQTIRGNDRAYLFRSDRHCRIRTLSPLSMEKDVEFYELVLRPGAALRSEPHFRGTRELLTVQTGRMRVTADDDVTELQPGDSAHYRADTPHVIENLGDTEASAYLVVLYT